MLYLGDDPRKHQREIGKRARGGKEGDKGYIINQVTTVSQLSHADRV